MDLRKKHFSFADSTRPPTNPMRASPPSTRPRSSASPSPSRALSRQASSSSMMSLTVVPPPPPRSRPQATRQPTSVAPFSPPRGALAAMTATERDVQQSSPLIRPPLPLARGGPSSSSPLIAALSHPPAVSRHAPSATQSPGSGRGTPTRHVDGRRSPPLSLPSKLHQSPIRRAPPPPPSALRLPELHQQHDDDMCSTASFGPMNFSFGGTTTKGTATAVPSPSMTTTAEHRTSYVVERVIDPPQEEHHHQQQQHQRQQLQRVTVIAVPSFESVTSPMSIPSPSRMRGGPRTVVRSPLLPASAASGYDHITTHPSRQQYQDAPTSSPGSSLRGDGEVPVVTFPSPVQSGRGDASLSSGALGTMPSQQSQQQQQQHQHNQQQQQQQRSATPEQSHGYQIDTAPTSPDRVNTTVHSALRTAAPVPAAAAGHVATAPATSAPHEHSHDQYRLRASPSLSVSLARNDHFAEWCVAVATSVEVQLGDRSRHWS
jgi:hypothetical protein